MLEQNSLKVLKNKKNLLAFSGGVDSTALFFLLQDQKIVFDIAIVNYNLREKAKEEVLYAKELAKKYNIPVIAAGGIWDKNDIDKYLAMGCAGVQMGTRFIGTYECDADDNFKEILLNAKETTKRN